MLDPYAAERPAQHAALRRWKALDWPNVYPKQDCALWAEISAKSAPMFCPVCRDDDNLWSDRYDNGTWLCRSCNTEFVTPRWIRWMEGQVEVDEDAIERQAALDQAAEWETPTEAEVDDYLSSLD
jgi:ribosomal protein L37AE/L43A